MVGHEAIRKHLNLALVAVFLEPQQIRCAIINGEKNVIATIATLGYVVRDSGKYCSG